ncbi:MAG: ABC transporter ATP-binding protein [Paracoccaceae bacterium]
MLEVQELTIRSAAQSAAGPLVGPVGFAVPEGGSLVIMGETGAGKSLIAQAVMGSLPGGLSAGGAVVLDGQRLDTLARRDREALWGRRITLLPQEPWRALDPLMPSLAQVAETHRLVRGQSAREARRSALTDFASLGLAGAEGRRPGELSGGMGQRVAFAAARAGGGRLLLADEPTKGLDRDRAAKILALLKETPAAGGALIVITHDVGVAEAIGGAILVLKSGRTVEAGATAEVLARPQNAYTRALIEAAPKTWAKLPRPDPGPALIEADRLTVGRGGTALIEDVSLTLRLRERVALVGPSGIGKSSLLDTLAGLIPPLAGSVRKSPDIGAHGLQKIYQDPPSAFAPRVSLGTGLRDVARRHRVDWSRIAGLLESLKIDEALLARRPDAVSGGELQRISIARVLAVAPKVLFADEPTSRLDPLTQKETMTLLSETAEAMDTAVLLVTHDTDLATAWAGRTVDLVAPPSHA